MQKALLTLPVKGTTASVNEIDESVNKLKMKKKKILAAFTISDLKMTEASECGKHSAWEMERK